MLIVCPNCATSYQVDPSSLGMAGRTVRCVRCRNTWFAYNPDAMTAVARAHREDVAAFAAATLAGDLADPPAASTLPLDESAPPIVEAAPPLVPDGPPEPRPETQPEGALLRDDRGPAPRRDPLPEPTPKLPVADDLPPAETEAGPAAADPAVPAPTPPEPVDVETVAARRLRRTAQRRSQRRKPILALAALVLLTINAGLIAFRNDVVQWLPQTASLYAAIGFPVNLRGLAFTDIVTSVETQDGVQVLLIDGVIKSESRRVAEVPRLRFAVRNAGGQEIHNWTALPARNAIAPGASMPFRSRLASPPPESHAVLVRFFNRRDLGDGVK